MCSYLAVLDEIRSDRLVCIPNRLCRSPTSPLGGFRLALVPEEEQASVWRFTSQNGQAALQIVENLDMSPISDGWFVGALTSPPRNAASSYVAAFSSGSMAINLSFIAE